MMIERATLRTPLRAAFRPLLLAVALLAIAAGASSAQEPATAPEIAVSDTIREIRLTDGSVIYGRVASVEADRVIVVTQAGVRIELSRAQIRSTSRVRGDIREGEVWLEDPNRTRLFFGPTGRSLRGGEGYVGAFELFLPFLSIGVTDRITMAGGTPVIPEVIGRVIYLAPKVQLLAAERMQLSSGVLAFFNLDGDEFEDDTDVVGVLYGAGTWGSQDNAISAGAGWAFAGSDVENRPAFMLGGETRISRRIKLISENYLVTYTSSSYEGGHVNPDGTYNPGLERKTVESLGLLSGGVRIFGERLAGDLGIGVGLGGGEGVVCCLPLVNFVYNFGGSR